MPGSDADGNEPSDDVKQSTMKKIEEAMKTNQEIERINNEINAIQAKVKVAIRQNNNINTFPEVALMRLSNYREAKPEESVQPAGSTEQLRTSSQDLKVLPSARGEPPKEDSIDSNTLENFALEEIPPKIIIIDQKSSDDTHLIAYHSGNFI